jgi:hypothetical protein
MRARVTKLVAALSAVAAFAVGGAALAGASSTPTPAPAAPAVPAQSDVQQGDQTAPDIGTSSESSSESSSDSESATANDGPGGHADEPGNPNADNQFQGEQ